MLHVLPIELSLSVLSYLPLPTLCSLPILSRQWFDLFSANQSTIFHNAAVIHGYIQPEIILLDDALSLFKGSPWDGATDWKDFCRRCFQLCANWEGNGRIVPRLVTPSGSDIHRIKVDEKAGICITTRMLGGLAVTHLFSGVLLWSLPPYHVRAKAHCEYENGYLVFDRLDGYKEVWRLASDFAVEDEAASHSPPDEGQLRASTFAAAMHLRYAPQGHFRPWAKLSFPEITLAYRFAYPTLLCANDEHAFLHDVRSGVLVQTIDLDVQPRPDGGVCYVDVNERYAFVCEPRALHVYSRRDRDAAEVLEVPHAWSLDNASRAVVGPGNPFISVLPLHPGQDDFHPNFLAAHVSRDGRDLVVLTTRSRVIFIRDFERICRGEISLAHAGQVLRLWPGDQCFYLAFEHGRVCVATLHGLYIVNVDSSPSIDSTKVVLVRPYVDPTPEPYYAAITCMQLTDRRIYFTWEDARRRDDVPLYNDGVSSLYGTPCMDRSSHEAWPWLNDQFDPRWGISVGCIDFSLMPESFAVR